MNLEVPQRGFFIRGCHEADWATGVFLFSPFLERLSSMNQNGAW